MKKSIVTALVSNQYFYLRPSYIVNHNTFQLPAHNLEILPHHPIALEKLLLCIFPIDKQLNPSTCNVTKSKKEISKTRAPRTSTREGIQESIPHLNPTMPRPINLMNNSNLIPMQKAFLQRSRLPPTKYASCHAPNICLRPSSVDNFSNSV